MFLARRRAHLGLAACALVIALVSSPHSGFHDSSSDCNAPDVFCEAVHTASTIGNDVLSADPEDAAGEQDDTSMREDNPNTYHDTLDCGRVFARTHRSCDALAWRTTREQSHFKPLKRVLCDHSGKLCLQRQHEDIGLGVRRAVKHLMDALTSIGTSIGRSGFSPETERPGFLPGVRPAEQPGMADEGSVIISVAHASKGSSSGLRKPRDAIKRKAMRKAMIVLASAIAVVGVRKGSPLVVVCLPAALRGLTKLAGRLGQALVGVWQRSWRRGRWDDVSTAMVLFVAA